MHLLIYFIIIIMGHSYNHNNHLPGVNQYDPYTQQPNINQGYPQYQ